MKIELREIIVMISMPLLYLLFDSYKLFIGGISGLLFVTTFVFILLVSVRLKTTEEDTNNEY